MANKSIIILVDGMRPDALPACGNAFCSEILSTGAVLLANAFGFFFKPEFTPDLRSMVIFALLLGVYFAVKKLWKKKLSSIWLILLSACLGIAVCSVAELL